MNLYLIVSIAIIVLSVYLVFKKESFEMPKEIKQEDFQVNYRPSNVHDNNGISELIGVLKNIYTSESRTDGANVTTQQDKYDLLYKDILINSEKRNVIKYPNPNSYSMDLNLNINNIYKAELIEVYIPAATDNAVNIPTFANRLYFCYYGLCGFITIQAGTYLSPDSIACELSKQFEIMLEETKCPTDGKFGIIVTYNKNLNRYIFSDNCEGFESLVIFPVNEYTIHPNLIVEKSICKFLMLNLDIPYISGPKVINCANGILFVDVAVPGSYGSYIDCSGDLINIPQQAEKIYGNCIISGVVLTNDKLYLSLDKLNGNTCNIIQYQSSINNKGNVPNIFCQVPNNTCVSSSSVKTLLNQGSMYSSVQFYNPPINRINTLIIQWYTETGCLVRILDHCFTLRVYYFQKRYSGTDFSIPIL
jgi:hypothetical protein